MNAPTVNPLLEAALTYAKRGWPVFPCDPSPKKPAAKRPLVNADRGPDGKPIPGTGWPAKASTDEAVIRGWWKRYPRALIGCSPGSMGGFVVDLDPKEGSLDEVRARLVDLTGPLPACAETQTQSGGRHLWFRHPEGEWGNHALGLSGIDIRCDAGYVILPPSVMGDGKSYAWLDGIAFDPVTAPDVPAPLLAHIRGRKESGRLSGAVSTRDPLPLSGSAFMGNQAVRRYVQKAVDGVASEVAAAPKGGRGSALYRAACQLGRFVQAGGLSEREAIAVLEDASERNGLMQADGRARVDREIQRGLTDGEASAEEVVSRLKTIESESARKSQQARRLRTDAPPAGGSSGAAEIRGTGEVEHDDHALALFPLTDLGNAERFAVRYRGRLMHNAALGWFFYDGRRWATEGAEAFLTRAANATARAIQEEASALEGTPEDIEIANPNGKGSKLLSEKLVAWGRASESAAKLRAMVEIAKGLLDFRASGIDSDPWVLNVLNGTLRFSRGNVDHDRITLHPHRPDDLITKLAPVTYDPNAECPAYDRFLSEVQPGRDMRRFLHAWAGYSLTGYTAEQKLCFFYGKGRNGKSTLVDAWAGIAGDYSTTVPIETFLNDGRGRAAGAATPDLAALPGVRFLRVSEPEKGAKLAEALIKAATGGEPMKVRHLQGRYFDFRPVFKLTLSGNYRPRVTGTDEGIWRRLALVPWLVTVEKPDLDLPAKLAAEGSGILNRLLDGLRDYLDCGMTWPDSVDDATREYRNDSDPLGRFLEECVVTNPNARVQSATMHALFAAWCRAMGETPWSNKGLSGALLDRGLVRVRANGSFWDGVSLLKSPLDFEGEDPLPPSEEDSRWGE